MTGARAFQAVISDMDGVLTSTAVLHERAWKRIFDAFLQARSGGDPQPFSSADYRAHVDGKPRYDGVRDFLRSRAIAVPEGAPGDGPDQETVRGLGNRKDAMFQELLASEGIHAFDDAVAALARWRRGGLPVAVISASRNCRRILEAADLMRYVDLVVDGQVADELHLEGKRGILEEAARRLKLQPEHAVVLEDAVSGVRAAHEAGFGLVVGIDRTGHGDELRQAGANEVVSGLHRVVFPRAIPALLDRLDELETWHNAGSPALFIDFDGTLSPIVDDPAAATLPDATRCALEAVASIYPVAVISGRDREDVAARVGLPDLWYAGNHGFDIAGPGHRHVFPEAQAALGDVAGAAAELERRLGDAEGVLIERKRFSVAVHTRRVRQDAVRERVGAEVADIQRETGLRLRSGKEVFELEPDVRWNKGYALRWLMNVMDVDPASHLVLYLGDDVTDEDAFAALAGDGLSVLVGDEVSTSLADYRLDTPEEVRELLQSVHRTPRR